MFQTKISVATYCLAVLHIPEFTSDATRDRKTHCASLFNFTILFNRIMFQVPEKRREKKWWMAREKAREPRIIPPPPYHPNFFAVFAQLPPTDQTPETGFVNSKTVSILSYLCWLSVNGFLLPDHNWCVHLPEIKIRLTILQMIRVIWQSIYHSSWSQARFKMNRCRNDYL